MSAASTHLTCPVEEIDRGRAATKPAVARPGQVGQTALAVADRHSHQPFSVLVAMARHTWDMALHYLIVLYYKMDRAFLFNRLFVPDLFQLTNSTLSSSHSSIKVASASQARQVLPHTDRANWLYSPYINVFQRVLAGQPPTGLPPMISSFEKGQKT